MIDWDDLRFFLSVARHAHLGTAAAELKVASSTVGRRLASIEKSLGARLLDRTPDGYTSTSAGEEVVAKAELIEAMVLGLERNLGDCDAECSGHVRVACVEGIANHILAPSMPAFHRRYPDVVVDLLPDAKHLSLSMREADIAVRLRRPIQQDVVTRCVGRLAFGLYASETYLAERGPCDLRAGCPDQMIVAQGGDIQGDEQREWFAGLTHRASVSTRTASHEAAVSIVVSGGGLACLADFRARRERRLIRIDTPEDAPVVEVWSISHKDNRDVARVRAAREHIIETMERLDDPLPPARLFGETQKYFEGAR